MSLSPRILARSVLALTFTFSLPVLAQTSKPQFVQPQVELTTGPVVSFSLGDTQVHGLQDILYVEKPTAAGTVNVGLLLNTNGSGFTNLNQNQRTFQNVTGVVATIADIDGDGVPDFVFATSPTSATGAQLCVYYGTKAGFSTGAYMSSESGCTSFPLPGGKLPVFASVAAAPYTPGSRAQIYLTDSANDALYVIGNAGRVGDGRNLYGFSLTSVYPLGADGAGPIVTGDFNRDNKTDLIVNGQSGNTAAVYLGNGDGTFAPPAHYGQGVHSMLLHDVDGDGIADLIAEADRGVIQIFKGHADGTFDSTSEGGTTAPDATSGAGGHLAAINPVTLALLTTTPAGLSVLTKQPGGPTYAVQGIYNIGSGRTAFALADFFNQGALDLAVGAAEGVAIVLPSQDGGFLTSRAYASFAPATSVAAAKFRTSAALSDVAVAIGPAQSQVMLNNGDGTFTPSTAATPAMAASGFPANLWARIQAGSFAGLGKPGLLYSIAGLPLPSTGSGTLVQAGNGDGTFAAPVAASGGSGDTLFGTGVVADLNGDGIDDIAINDHAGAGTLLTPRAGSPFQAGLSVVSSSTGMTQVAAGFFKTGRTSKQDLVIQQGALLVPFVNSGDGQHFTAMQPLAGTPSPSALVPAAVMIADLDGDQNGDVIALYYNPAFVAGGDPTAAPNQLYIWFGNGDGTFGQPEIVPLSRHFYLAAIADMNSDGHPDILLADDSVLSILYNQGGRTFHSDFGTGCSPCGELHFLAGQGINDIAIADVNGDGKPDVIVANGGETIANVLALGGGLASSVTPKANANVRSGGVTVLPNASTTQPVTGSVSAQPEPSSVNQNFNVVIVITPPAGATVPPSGTAQLTIGGQLIGTATILPIAGSTTNSSGATVSVGASGIAPGSYPISVAYSGDVNYSSTTLTGTHVIAGNTTTTTLALCVGPTASCPASGPVNPPYVPVLSMTYGQVFNGAATVTKAAGDTNPLSGTTTFLDNGTVLCTYATIGGSCPNNVGAGLQTGQHTITATYSGDPNHSGSSSSAVVINVAPDSTTTTLTGTPNPALQGTPVTFTVTVTGQYAAPTGTFTFSNGNTVFGTATLAATGPATSTATFTTSTLPVGTDQISANYGGNQNFLPSGSGSFAETITALAPASFTLTVAPQTLNIGLGYSGALAVTVTALNGFAAPVNLSCGPLPTEASCAFISPVLNGGGVTTLYISTTSPHDCNNTNPYFLGSNGNSPGFRALAVPAMAGLLALFLPGRRRWLRGLLMLALAAGAMQVSGCGHCTDLATKPGTYNITVTGASGGSSGQSQSQTVTINVVI